MDEKNLVADDLIYIEDVIDMFGNKASKNVIYAWVRQKQLPALKVGKRYVFSRQKVKRFIEKILVYRIDLIEWWQRCFRCYLF